MIAQGPASHGQEQLWLAEQAEAGRPANNVPHIWHLYGPLDRTALQAAMDHLVARHAVLRTVLRTVDSELRQIVTPAGPVPVVSLAPAHDPVRPDDPVPSTVDEFVNWPFDLGTEWPLRVGLVAFAPEHHLLVVVLHHIACDGNTSGLLQQYLIEAYEAYEASARPAPVEADDGYLGYARTKDARWAADEPDAGQWLRGLARAARDHRPLPASDRPGLIRPAAVRDYELPAGPAAALFALAAGEGCTPPMALAAVFAAVLARWTGEQRPIFSSPVSTRRDPRYERTLGFFVNSLPLVVQVGDEPSVPELLRRARTAVLAALDHAQAPPEEIRQALAGGAGDPLHDVTFVVERIRPEQFRMGALTARWQPVSPRHTMFGLSFHIWLGETGHRISLCYDRGAVSPELADRLVDHFREAVATAGSGQPLPDLPERDRVSVLGWASGPPSPSGSHLQQPPGLLARLAAHVEARPDADAVRAGDHALSYAALWHRAGRLADRLRASGVRADDVVAISQPRTIELLVSVLGVLRSGAAYMPLDPRDPATRRDAILRRSRVHAILTLGPEGADPVITAVATPADPESVAGPDTADDPDALAYVINTSGSTGAPKGVQISRASLANYLCWAAQAYLLDPASTVPLHTSVAYDLAVTSLLGPLYAGGCVEILEERRGPAAVAEEFGRGYQLVKGTPGHLFAALDATEAAPPRRWPAVLAIGGEHLPAEPVRRWISRAGTVLFNEYGPTETTVASTAYAVREAPESDRVPIGTPIRATTVYVVDERLRLVPVGVPGELVIGGAGLARGYRDAPAATAERFVPDPFGPPGGRLYRTGDLARWRADGQLELLGRDDDQVKILGYRVEPGEVEAVLAAAGGIGQAAVLPQRLPDGRVRLVAFISPGPVDGATREYLAQRLPAHLVPEAYVEVAALPLTNGGKVDRAALRRRLPTPPSTPAGPVPRSEGWTGAIRAAWCEVLGRPDIPGDVSFFAVGGTSLMLFRLDSALRKQGVSGFSVTDLFRRRTIDEFAAYMATQPAPDPTPVSGGGDGC